MEPSATRASLSARDGTLGRRSIGPKLPLEPVDEGLRTGNLGCRESVGCRDLHPLAVAPGPFADPRLVETVVDRGIEDAENRPAVPDQGDGNRPVGMTRGEGPGAVDGIDDPDMALPEAGRIVRRLLGKPAGLGKQFGEMAFQESIEGDVGLGHRGALSLVPELGGRLRAGAEIGQCQITRPAGCIAHGWGEGRQ